MMPAPTSLALRQSAPASTHAIPDTPWPPNYTEIFMQRQERFLKIRGDLELQAGAREYYKDNPVAFINDWGVTYDPRNASQNLPTIMPFKLFPIQEDLIHFFQELIDVQTDGLIEKCRDMGATWVAVGFTTWLFLFHPGSSVGWGSRKEQLVDKIGDPDSIFEKIRMFLNYLPFFLKPFTFDMQKHCSFMKIVNPANRSTITGEAGDNIGRGGRKSIYFKDESAHYERPEKIEAALGDNTNVQIDISSVNGPGNVFHRRRQAGTVWLPPEKREESISKDSTWIFVMDWRDHPAKDQAWYDRRKKKAEEDGLSHIFAQEVDRDYSAAVEGVLIPGVWVKAAIDAHKVLGFEPEGMKKLGFDPYDESGDAHSYVVSHGVVVTDALQWSLGDTGQATAKVLSMCKEKKIDWMQYDGIGVGAGAKSECNRQRRAGVLRKGMIVKSFMSTAKVQDKNEHIIPDDEETPRNKDFFANLKAQAGWNARLAFQRTYKAVVQGESYYSPDELVSLDSNCPFIDELVVQLSQPTYTKQTGSGKIIINKKPDGSKSPNLFDAFIMSRYLVKTFDPSEFVVSGGPVSVMNKAANM